MSIKKNDVITASDYNTYMEGKDDYEIYYRLPGNGDDRRSFIVGPPAGDTVSTHWNCKISPFASIGNSFYVKDSLGSVAAEVIYIGDNTGPPYIKISVITDHPYTIISGTNPEVFADVIIVLPGDAYTVEDDDVSDRTSFWVRKYPHVIQGDNIRAYDLTSGKLLPTGTVEMTASKGKSGQFTSEAST